MTEASATAAESESAATAGDAPRRRSPAVLVLTVAIAIACLAIGAVVAVSWASDTDTGGSEFVVEVAPGTGERIAAGEEVELIPSVVELDVGDTLVITNDDDQVHQVGPYVVGPYQTLRQTFATAGTVEGLCSLHPSGQVEIIVR